MLFLLLLVYVNALFTRCSAIAVTGPSGGVDLVSGSRPFRLNINDLAASGPAWDLYLLSLQQMQQRDQSDPSSHFQIAGRIPCNHD